MPRELHLRPYPNPVGDVVTLEFELQTPSAVAVTVYNTLGAVLHEERSDRVFPAGKTASCFRCTTCRTACSCVE